MVPDWTMTICHPVFFDLYSDFYHDHIDHIGIMFHVSETKTRINLDTRYQDDTLYAPIQQTGKTEATEMV